MNKEEKKEYWQLNNEQKSVVLETFASLVRLWPHMRYIPDTIGDFRYGIWEFPKGGGVFHRDLSRRLHKETLEPPPGHYLVYPCQVQVNRDHLQVECHETPPKPANMEGIAHDIAKKALIGASRDGKVEHCHVYALRSAIARHGVDRVFSDPVSERRSIQEKSCRIWHEFWLTWSHKIKTYSEESRR